MTHRRDTGQAAARRPAGAARGGRRAVAALLALAVLALPASAPAAARRIAVLPFRSAPAAPGLAPLEAGFHSYVGLLVSATAGWEPVPAETAARIAEAWGAADAPPTEEALRLLREAGAGAALAGTLQSQAGALRLRAGLHLAPAPGAEPVQIALNGRTAEAAAVAGDLAQIVSEALVQNFPRALRPPLGGAPAFLPALLEPSFGGRGPGENVEQTETFLRAALKLDPNNADAHYQLGVLHARAAGPGAAIEELRTAVELAPKSARYHLALGTAYYLEGQDEEALTEFLQSTVIDEGFTEGFVALAALQRRLGDAEAAREALDRAAKAGPREARVLTALGADALLAHDAEAARELFERALAANPRFAPAATNLALIAWERGDLDGARRDLERALAAEPANPAALLGLGVVAGAQGSPEKAADHFRRAMEAGAPRAVALHNLGSAQLQAGSLGEAEQTLLRAVDLAPDYAAPRASLGLLQLLGGRLGEAVATFSGAQGDAAADATLIYDLALVEQLRGNQQQALVGYLRALKSRRDLLPAHINLGILFEAMDRPDKALTEYLKALSGGETLPEVYTYLGQIYARRGYGSMAEETIRKTILVDPSSPLAHHAIATAAESLDPQAAARAWSRFLDAVRRDRNRSFWVPIAERRLAELGPAR